MIKGYNSLDGVVLVMNWRSRASQVVDLVDLEEKGLNDVVSDELKSGVTKMVHDVLFPSGEEIIHHDYTITPLDQAVNQMTADESSSTSDHNP